MASRWSSAFGVDETFRFSDRVMASIEGYLGREPSLAVQFAAQEYRSFRENESGKPKAANVRKQLNKLSDASERLLSALELDDNTIDELDESNPDQSTSELRRQCSENVRRLREVTWTAENRLKTMGRPRDESRRYFVGRITDIWSSVHGQPARIPSKDAEPFVDFVSVCVEELPGFEHGLDDLLAELNSSPKK